VISELDAIREKFGDDRRTEIVPREDDISIEDLIRDEEVVITVSHTGYIKRTALSTYRSQRRGGKGRIGMTTREEDAVRHLFVASTHDYILVFTSAGKVHWLKVHAIPDVSSAGRGKPVVNLIQTGPDEKVAAMVNVREFEEGRYVVLATRLGYIKKTPLTAFANPRAAGIIALALEPGDDVLGAGLSDGQGEIFMATAAGKAIRFRETDVRPMGRSARGVRAVRMRPGDQLVEMEVLSGKPDVLSVTAKGYGKRTSLEEYRVQGRGGSGIINVRITGKNGQVVACREAGDEEQVLLITAQGKLIRMDVAGISRLGRAAQGVRLIQTDEGDEVVAAIITAERVEEGKTQPVATAPDPDEEPMGPDEETEEDDASALEDEGDVAEPEDDES
jgi:DNA gyrase subunit A